MEFVNGGHLLFHMHAQPLFPENMARFYAAETTLALEVRERRKKKKKA
jgi:hypothetical protein